MRKSYFYFLLTISTAFAASAAFAAGADDDLLTGTTRSFLSAVEEGRHQDAKEALGIIQLLAHEEDPRALQWLGTNSEEVIRVMSMDETHQAQTTAMPAPSSTSTRAVTAPTTRAPAPRNSSTVIAELEQNMRVGINNGLMHLAYDSLGTMRALATSEPAATSWLTLNPDNLIEIITLLATPEAVEESRARAAAGNETDRFNQRQLETERARVSALDHAGEDNDPELAEMLAQIAAFEASQAQPQPAPSSEQQVNGIADALRRMSPTGENAEQPQQAQATASPLRAHITAHPDLAALRSLLTPVATALPTVQASLTSLDALLSGDNPLLHQVLGVSGLLFSDNNVFDRAELTLSDVQASMLESVVPFMSNAAYSYNGSAIIPVQLQGMIERSISTIERNITEASQLEAVRVLYSKAWTLASTMKTEGNPQGVKSMLDAVVANCREGSMNNEDKINRVFLAYVAMLQHLGVM